MRACGGGRSSLRLSPPLFALSAPLLPPGPLPLRRVASGRPARPPFGPRSGACALPRSARSPGPALGPSPPAPPLGPCAASLRCGLRGRSLPPLRLGCPRCAAASLFGRPCFVSGFPLRFGACRRGPPLARPLCGFGAGGLRPGGPARPFGPLVLASGPPGLLCSPGLPGCAITSGGGCQDHSQRPALRADLDRSRLRRCVIAKIP